MKTSVTSRRKVEGRRNTDYLRLVSGNEKIVIRSTDGKRTIVQSVDLFTCGVDEDLHNLDTDVQGLPTKEMAVQIFEMTKSGTLAHMYGSFGEKLDSLCLEQSQIISFVENHEEWFRTGSYTMSFLFMVSEKLCVVRVTSINGEFYANIKSLVNKSVWPSSSKVRFVLPQP